MANDIYKKGIENILNGNIDLDTDTIEIILVDTADYTLNIATDDALADIPAAARVAISGALTSVTLTDGVFDAADVTLTSVSGDVSEAIVIYKDSGVEATSYLIAILDTGTGLPVTPDGGNITVAWAATANRIINFDA